MGSGLHRRPEATRRKKAALVLPWGFCGGKSGPCVHAPADTVAGAFPTGAGCIPTWRHPRPQRRRPVLPWRTERTLTGTPPSSGLPGANSLGSPLCSPDPGSGHRARAPPLLPRPARPPCSCELFSALREREAASAEQASLAVGFEASPAAQGLGHRRGPREESRS